MSSSRIPLPVTLIAGWVGADAEALAQEFTTLIPGAATTTQRYPNAVTFPSRSFDEPTADAVGAGELAQPHHGDHRPNTQSCAARNPHAVRYADVIDTIERTLRRSHPPAHLFLAIDPLVPLVDAAETVLGDPALTDRIVIDALIVVVNGPAMSATANSLRSFLPLPGHLLQAVAIADVVVVKAVERLTEAGFADCRWRLRRANAAATIVASSRVPDQVSMIVGWQACSPRGVESLLRRATADSTCGTIRGTTLAIDGGSVDPQALAGWIEDLLEDPGLHLLRLAGMATTLGDGRHVLLHGVGHTIRGTSAIGPLLGDRLSAQIRLIGTGLEPKSLRRSLAGCIGRS